MIECPCRKEFFRRGLEALNKSASGIVPDVKSPTNKTGWRAAEYIE